MTPPSDTTKWLNLESVIDSKRACLVVIMIFASIAGLVVAAWPHLSRFRNSYRRDKLRLN